VTLEKRFKKFLGGPGRLDREQMRVALYPNGEFYLNAKAYAALGRPKAVAFYFDEESEVIAIEPANPRFMQNFIPVKKGCGWAIHGSSFCRHFGIKPERAERFNRPDINNEGILLLDLRDTSTTGRERKKKLETRRRGDKTHKTIRMTAVATDELSAERTIDIEPAEMPELTSEEAAAIAKREADAAKHEAQRQKRLEEREQKKLVELKLITGETIKITPERAREIRRGYKEYQKRHPTAKLNDPFDTETEVARTRRKYQTFG
jgi:hypothetical protein